MVLFIFYIIGVFASLFFYYLVSKLIDYEYPELETELDLFAHIIIAVWSWVGVTISLILLLCNKRHIKKTKNEKSKINGVPRDKR